MHPGPANVQATWCRSIPKGGGRTTVRYARWSGQRGPRYQAHICLLRNKEHGVHYAPSPPSPVLSFVPTPKLSPANVSGAISLSMSLAARTNPPIPEVTGTTQAWDGEKWGLNLISCNSLGGRLISAPCLSGEHRPLFPRILQVPLWR